MKKRKTNRVKQRFNPNVRVNEEKSMKGTVNEQKVKDPIRKESERKEILKIYENPKNGQMKTTSYSNLRKSMKGLKGF